MKSIGILVFMVFMFSITACKKDHCDDGKNNKDEAGLDCGGKDCKPCESCFDGITNQGELGVDCGGPCAICQLEWKEVRTGTTKLTAVNFYKNVGVAVGENGVILKSLDSGKTWSSLSSGTTSNLKSIHVLDENNFFVCGVGDLVISSTDGTSFSSIKTAKTSDWRDIHFTDQNTGTVCGSKMRILYTSDAGKTWVKKIEPKVTSLESFVSMSFLTNLEAYIIGGSDLLRTLDGGKNWVSIDGFSTLKAEGFKTFENILYKTTSDVYCITDSAMFISINSTKWADKLLNVGGGKVTFLKKMGLYSGQNTSKSEGKVLISFDGGRKWEKQVINASIQYTAGEILSKEVMVVVGDKGTIIRRDK